MKVLFIDNFPNSLALQMFKWRFVGPSILNHPFAKLFGSFQIAIECRNTNTVLAISQTRNVALYFTCLYIIPIGKSATFNDFLGTPKSHHNVLFSITSCRQ